MLRIAPRNQRTKRILKNREPKAVENPKATLFLRFTTCSQVIQDVLADLFLLTQPFAKKFTKKNDIHPFEDPASLEFFSEKNDTSLFVFGSSNKKRPHALTIVRMFNHKVLDMLELSLDASKFRPMREFKTEKVPVGLRPLLVFAGTSFESPVANEFTLAKSLLLDLFKKDETAGKIDVEGLKYIICVSADEPGANGSSSDDPSSKQVLHIRFYLIRTKRSGQKLPRVEVEEMGPRLDFRIGRTKQADESTWKEAMRRPKTSEERTKKNITTDAMGDKLGRIHLGRQDLTQLQTRKMKGLKRGRGVADAEAGAGAEALADDDGVDVEMMGGSDGGSQKRKRKA